jgi:hypothetical protein
MSFTEDLKLRIRKQSHFRCCLCHALGVEIHHIVPQVENGSDEDENAAPLCPTCHGIYGANPQKRKFIREARDFWYEICRNRFNIPTEQIKEISDTLKTVATKEDITRLSIQNSSYVLGSNTRLPWEHIRYSFTREEFIHPLIVNELKGLLWDSYETITSVDLTTANHSNRFFGDFSIREESGRIWVGWKNDQHESFTYSHIATSPSGVHMVECYECGGGSGVFGSIALLTLECDRSLVELSKGSISTRERVLLKTLGSILLGDRYSGEIIYREGKLIIGPDEGWFSRGDKTYHEIPIL